MVLLSLKAALMAAPPQRASNVWAGRRAGDGSITAG